MNASKPAPLSRIVLPDPYAAAARAIAGDMRLITSISCNDMRAMGLLIRAQHDALAEIATVAEQQCVASVNDRAAGRAILEAMVRHGFFDPIILQKLTEDPHGKENQSQG